MIGAMADLRRIVLAVILMGIATAVSSGQESSAKSDDSKVEQLGPGDHVRTLVVDNLGRTAIVHVPPKYDPERPTPVVLALHGAAMSGRVMALFCGLNETADEKGFIVVYPYGTGIGPLLTWNAGAFVEEIASQADDVKFINKLLDDVGLVCRVDPKRVYACGMSNGGMMCYRLAADLSNRIAAIAPVGGTMAIGDVHPQRPVSVIHFHGTLDPLVPYDMGLGKPQMFLRLRSVEESVQAWVKLNGCDAMPTETDVLSKADDELKVVRQIFGPGNEGSEVVAVTVEGGGHTWPGQKPPVKFIGKSTMSVSANELLWAFFEKHPMK